MAEVASAFVSLMPSAKGFGSKLDSQIGGDVDGAGKRAGVRFGGALKVGALAALGGAALAAGFLKGAVDDASNLAEAQSKVGVVFGKQAGQIMAASKTSATAMGLTKAAYLDATGTLGNLLVSLDIAPKKSAAMSQQMVKLAGDLASFNNTSPEEALDALKSGLTGETEPLKRFGVNMNDATLKAEALKLGLIKSTKDALTPQNKALAAQALIMDQTKTAQGDFARTSGGLANQQRILSAQFGNLKTTIGQALLPVVTKFVTFLNNLGPVFAKVGTFIAPTLATVKTFFSALTSGAGGTSGLLTTFKTFGAIIAANFLPVLRTMSTTFTTVILPAFLRLGSYLAANLIPIFRQVGIIIATQVVPIVASLARFFYGTLYPAVIRIVTAIATQLKPVFDQLFKTIRTSVLPTVQRLLVKFREYQPTIQKVISVVLKVVGVVLILAAKILGKVLPVLIRFAGFLLRNVVGAVIAVIGVLVKIVSHVIRTGTAFVNGAKKVNEFANKVDAAIRKALGFIKGLPGKAVSALGDLSRTLYNAGKALIQGLINGVEAMIGSLKSKLGSITKLIPKHKGPIEKDRKLLEPAGRAIMTGLIKALESREAALKKTLARITDRISGIKDAAKGLASTISSKFLGDAFGGNLDAFKVQVGLDTSNANAFKDALGQSAKKGLNGGLFRQLAESGNVDLAKQFASLSKADIKKYEDMFNARAKAAAGVGNSVADRVYGAALDQQTKELRAIRAELHAVLRRERQIHIHDKSGNPHKTAREVARQEAFAAAH